MIRYSGENQFIVDGITYSTLKIEYVRDKGNNGLEDQDCICFNMSDNNCISGMIPVVVVNIDVSFFKGNVSIPDTVKFDGCEYVVVLLKPYCFSKKDLVSINMSKYISMIFTGTFEDCINMEHVNLPPYLRYIEAEAFTSCIKLDQVMITPRVSFIENDAFEKCIGLKELYILSFPESPQCKVEEHAFTDCVNLKRIGLIESSREEIKENKEPKVTGYSRTKPNVLMCEHVPFLFRLARAKCNGKDELHYKFFEVEL